MKRKRCRWLILVVLLAAAALLLAQQTNTLKTTRYAWQSDRVPQAFEGYRIVQVSDLHNKRFGKGQRRLVRAIRDARPDMIALTGDFIDLHTKSLDAVTELLEGIQGLAPAYFIDGNWDSNSPYYGALLALLSQYDVMVLNGYTQLARDGGTMTLAGFPFWETKNFTQPADIVLYHSPNRFSLFAAEGCGLVLAGHNHGGQIALPGGRALIDPNGNFLPKYSAGVYHEGDAAMILSRGLGTSVCPFRLFAPPEIVVITLESGADV